MKTYTADPEKVRQLILRKKVTVKELAEGAGIAESTIRHWFSGHATPNFNSVIKLSRFLDVPAEEMIQTTND